MSAWIMCAWSNSKANKIHPILKFQINLICREHKPYVVSCSAIVWLLLLFTRFRPNTKYEETSQPSQVQKHDMRLCSKRIPDGQGIWSISLNNWQMWRERWLFDTYLTRAEWYLHRTGSCSNRVRLSPCYKEGTSCEFGPSIYHHLPPK